MKPAVERPLGQLTRGKTAKNRLRRVDIFFLLYDSGLIRRSDGLYKDAYYVDLGYGFEPTTTLESAFHFRKINPSLPVLGIEIAPDRVAAAQPFEDAITKFRLGGFNFPLQVGETVRAVRAFNVLRQYDEDQVAEAHQTMGNYLLPGGLLIEGTSNPFGQLMVANVLRKKESESNANPLVYEGLLFSTNFHMGFDPSIFQPVLPKNYIHRMLPGEKIYQFMDAWKFAARQTIAYKDLGMREWFLASAGALSEKGYRIDMRRKILKKGYLFWKFD